MSKKRGGTMKNYNYLKTKQVNHTLWVEIHNPPVNFITADLCEELYLLIREVEKDPGIRVFILTGGMEDTYIFHFSIPELAHIPNDVRKMKLDTVFQSRFGRYLVENILTFNMWLMDVLPAYEKLVLSVTKMLKPFVATPFLLMQMHRCYYAIERMSKITIAAISGSCSGGGTEMGACFDFRFMVDDQGFIISQPEIGIGIAPGGGGTARLPRLIGKAKALELMLHAEMWTAEEAKRNGLITDHFPKKQFHAKVQEFADNMGKRIPVAVKAIKRTVHEGMNSSLGHALCIEMGGNIQCMANRYTQNAMQEYMQVIKDRIEEPKNGKRGTMVELAEIMQSDEVIKRIFKD